jgi:inorganic triphosphatase YgiF
MEQEFKFALHEKLYKSVGSFLRQRFGEPSNLRQGNHFFDTADGLLQAHGIAVRLRQQNDDWLLTCKWGRRTDGALATVQEFERSVSSEVAGQLLQGQVPAHIEEDQCGSLPLAPEALALLGDRLADLALRAGFSNFRQCWLHDGLELALDHAEIGGQSEWELEIELVGGSLQAAEQLVADLREASIELVPQPLSKLQRLKQRRPEAFSAT